MQRIEIVIVQSERGMRLEDVLCEHFRALSKMYLREVVKTGGCEVNGRHENIGYKMRANDLIEIELDLSREHSMLPQDIPLEIIHEDHDLIVVVKPAGMLVHPSNREKNGTLLNALTFHFNREPEARMIRPGLVHRLDKDTSGLIVVAKNERAHRILCRQFLKKTVNKRYLALVEGKVETDEGTIIGDIGRDAVLKFWVLKEGGKPSESKFRVKRRFDEHTLLELEPVTGRTNQLRIHCASIGNPIVGDVERGAAPAHRLCLHAALLTLRHPTTSEFLTFESDISFSVPTQTREAVLQT